MLTKHFIVLDQFHIKISHLWWTTLRNKITFFLKWPSRLRVKTGYTQNIHIVGHLKHVVNITEHRTLSLSPSTHWVLEPLGCITHWLVSIVAADALELKYQANSIHNQPHHWHNIIHIRQKKKNYHSRKVKCSDTKKLKLHSAPLS